MITGIDPNAPVVVRRDLVVDAPLARVWRLVTDVASWPAWQPDITAAATARPLRAGDTFRWSTAGLEIASTVYSLRPRRRIVWGGSSHGIHGIHLWAFDVVGSSVHVRTDESWDGKPVLADVDAMRTALGDSLAAWLGHLKKAAERSGAAVPHLPRCLR